MTLGPIQSRRALAHLTQKVREGEGQGSYSQTSNEEGKGFRLQLELLRVGEATYHGIEEWRVASILRTIGCYLILDEPALG